jgi:hypothetical protein
LLTLQTLVVEQTAHRGVLLQRLRRPSYDLRPAHSGNSKRLVTRHYVSLAYTLPLNYKAKVAAIPGVTIIAGFPNYELSPQITAIGIGIALVLGLVAGFFPALTASRARIVDMLRQITRGVGRALTMPLDTVAT